MTCVCGALSEVWTIANPYSGEPMTYRRCANPVCRREYVQRMDGQARWIKSGVWCQDGECDAPTFRMIAHPRTGHPMRLWPNPAAVVAEYLARDPKITHPWPKKLVPGKFSVTHQYYCGSDCAPDLGALPHHELEHGGDPHPQAIGPCVAVYPARRRHEDCFTEERGAFLRVWLAELRLPEVERDALLALWERDRTA